MPMKKSVLPFGEGDDYGLKSLLDVVVELIIIADLLIPVMDIITIHELNQL